MYHFQQNTRSILIKIVKFCVLVIVWSTFIQLIIFIINFYSFKQYSLSFNRCIYLHLDASLSLSFSHYQSVYLHLDTPLYSSLCPSVYNFLSQSVYISSTRRLSLSLTFSLCIFIQTPLSISLSFHLCTTSFPRIYISLYLMPSSCIYLFLCAIFIIFAITKYLNIKTNLISTHITQKSVYIIRQLLLKTLSVYLRKIFFKQSLSSSKKA